jgi:hypothetical protein
MTILIPGTNWEASGGWIPASNGYRGLLQYGEQLGGPTQLLAWSPSRNRHADRLAAAHSLVDLIAAHTFAPGEQLHIIAHSHGGNVVLAASRLGLPRPVDLFIALNKPTLRSAAYRPGPGIARFFNISAARDWIQRLGARFVLGSCFDPHAINHVVDTRTSLLRPHAALIWDDDCRDLWWQWLQRQRGVETLFTGF